MDEKVKQKFDIYNKKLTNIYNRLMSKSKIDKYAIDFLSFIDIMKDIDNSEYINNWNNRGLENVYFKNVYSLINNILDNKELYGTIADSSIDIFRNSDFNFYEGYYKKLRGINKNEILDIILAFFNEFDSDYYEIVNKSLDDSELLISSIDAYSGFILNYDSIKEKIIVVSEKSKEDLLGAATIAHEYGHYFEISLLYNSDINSFHSKSKKTPFYEVSSSFFEYAFINFLKENKICNDDIDLILHNYYVSMFTYLYGISIISKYDDIALDSDCMFYLCGNNILEYSDKLKSDINYYELPSNGDYIDFINQYIYGLGQLFSIYMYDSYKEDPNNFKKEFKNALFTYPYSNSINAFEKVGINYDELIKGDKLKKTLKMK